MTMSPMTAGNNRDTCKPRKARLSTTGTSNGSWMLWGRNSTSKKMHTTDGVIPHSVGKCPEGTKGTGSKAVQMVQNLEGLGFTVIPFGQGFRDLSPPSKEFYKLLLEGNIQHGGNPILRWMAGNVVTRSDPAQNIKPDKAKSTEKMDGIVATIMALDRAIRLDVIIFANVNLSLIN